MKFRFFVSINNVLEHSPSLHTVYGCFCIITAEGKSCTKPKTSAVYPFTLEFANS